MSKYKKNTSHIVIPYGVKEIEECAFYDFESLISVEIPDSVASIGVSSFFNCSSLKNIVIPDSVVSIGRFAFGDCKCLKNVTLSNGLKDIGKSAFSRCQSLERIDIPSGVISIGDFSFEYCLSLKSVVISSGVKSIGLEAFYNCSKLSSVIIPDSVTDIAMNAFSSCSYQLIIHTPSGSYAEKYAKKQDISCKTYTSEEWDNINKTMKVQANTEQQDSDSKELKIKHNLTMTEKKYIPIFVGSTYSDLVEHRKAVMDALHKLKTIVNGMEYFGAKTGSPIEECLNAVRESQVYIGIFAMRYGSIEENSGKSFTHLEFIEAQRLKLPSLIYIIDEDKQPILVKDIETGNNAITLANLKEELKKKFTVSFFTTPEDLATKISQDLPPILRKIGITVNELVNITILQKKSQNITQNISAGDTIGFGGYNWTVLKVKDNKALIIMTEIIEYRPYNIEFEEVTWESCSLREYLNNEFYYWFDEHDKAMISKTTLVNTGNFEYKVDGGRDTDDRIFLLSSVEVSQYLPRQEDRKAKFNGNPWNWWLRSPGGSKYNAAYVGQMGNLGEMFNLGQKVTTEIFGVRPALWLQLD